MSIPAVITITVMLLYNMAGMFFVGLQNDSLQIGAISLSSPVYQILMALGTLIGAGGCAAIRLGIIYIPALYLLDFLFALNGLICTGVIIDYVVLGIGFFSARSTVS